MKLLIIIYDSGIEEDLTELTEELELPGWTKAFGAHGQGGTGTKLGDPIWPGTNNILYVAVPDDQVAGICQRLEDLKGAFRMNPGLTTFVVPLEEVSLGEANNPAEAASTNRNPDTA